jgi:peroxiredoxin
MRHVLFAFLLGSASLLASAQPRALPSTQSAPAAAPAPAPRAVQHHNLGKRQLALAGYDPVAYFPEGGGKPLRGLEANELEHGGARYRFASAAHLELFRAAPARYEPAHGGWCSYAMGKDGSKVEIDPQSFVVSGGRLFLFYKSFFADTRSRWLDDTAELEPRADSAWQKLSGEAPRKPASLASRLAELSASYAARSTPEQLASMEQAIADLARSEAGALAPRVGAKAPDFELGGARGERVRLSELLREGPVILSWYRGGWCPYCNLQLHAYQEVLADIRAQGAQLVALSPELPEHGLETARKNALSFPVLSDVRGAAARAYGLSFAIPAEQAAQWKEWGLDLAARHGEEAWTLPVPATFVVDREGIVRYAFVETDYRKRAEPSELLRVLAALPKKR